MSQHDDPTPFDSPPPPASQPQANQPPNWPPPPAPAAWGPPPGYGQPPRRGVSWPLIIGLVLLLGVIGFCVFITMAGAAGMGGLGGGMGTSLNTSRIPGYGEGGPAIAVIPVEGVIAEQGPAGRNPVALTLARFEKARQAKVSAVILHVNSPGGGVTASDALYEAILRFKKKSGIPVICLMGDMAASGGYYLAAAADWIIAAPSTLTGSIGVVIPRHNLQGLLEGKLGVRSEAITSAPQKDILSPFRDMRPEEREHVQGMVDRLYQRFIDVVIAGRGSKGLTEAEVRALQSTVLLGEQALEKKLVDELGYLDAAFAKAKEVASLEDAHLERYDPPPTFFETLMQGTTSARSPEAELLRKLQLGGSPSPFCYLWEGF